MIAQTVVLQGTYTSCVTRQKSLFLGFENMYLCTSKIRLFCEEIKPYKPRAGTEQKAVTFYIHE
ncbi:hypothetical protein HMPREF0766_10882 [Sphingobacterium spiritivorum ATCC 33861]|uniref:Uncharacterized protein n=1 Tax=Sphingobacterium spiritivorum ATCC 33861 TaxID=525373 RepID=D7VIR3_SPHSI|nr:hypothetical protein HMPREF0766_10882 [Sphingobacterium spiritivorum ATCC 33861]